MLLFYICPKLCFKGLIGQSSITNSNSHLMSERVTGELVANQKLCCTGTCPQLRLRTPALPGATLLQQLGTTKWLRPQGGPWTKHRHEALPALQILTSYHPLSVNLPRQHFADPEGSELSPLTGRTFPFLERGGCSTAE